MAFTCIRYISTHVCIALINERIKNNSNQETIVRKPHKYIHVFCTYTLLKQQDLIYTNTHTHGIFNFHLNVNVYFVFYLFILVHACQWNLHTTLEKNFDQQRNVSCQYISWMKEYHSLSLSLLYSISCIFKLTPLHFHSLYDKISSLHNIPPRLNLFITTMKHIFFFFEWDCRCRLYICVWKIREEIRTHYATFYLYMYLFGPVLLLHNTHILRVIYMK